MKLVRPNLADLYRSLTGRGSDPTNPPMADIEVPDLIVGTAEICRSLAKQSVIASAPLEESTGVVGGAAVAAGGVRASNALMTLSPGLWRISMALSAVVNFASPAAGTQAIWTINRPGGFRVWGLVSWLPAAGQVVVMTQEYTLHIPEAGWTLVLELDDPVTALAVASLYVTGYACRLL